MFRHKDVPNNLTFYNYIKSKTDWNKAVSFLERNDDSDLDLRINLEFDADKVLEELLSLYKSVGAVTWQSQNSFNLYGLSLTYNPNHPKDLWKKGSFGHPRYKVHSSYDYYEAVMNDKEHHLKDDYLDSLSFNTLLPEVKTKPHLYKLLNSFNFPVIRVTVRTINGLLSSPSKGDGGFHTDDSPFEVLRINVSLSNNGNFGLEYKNKKIIYTEAGNNIVVNTDKLHRSYIKETSNFQRTNLIIGLAPWLNYDSINNIWSLNHYYAKKHPYDLVKEKLICYN